MTSVANDTRRGILWALASSASFAWSGTFARPLLDAGWSVGLVITCRVLIAAAVLAIPAARAMRGRWHLLRTELVTIVLYGTIVVALCQTAYYRAVARMDVGVALLIEYTAPVALLAWLWARHGQRPSRLTALGAVVTTIGLVLVINIFSGARMDGVGLAWAFASMVGAAAYFVLSARPSELPPIVLPAAGMVVGGAVLLAAGAIGLTPMNAGASTVHFRSVAVPWFLPLLGIGVLSTGVAYALGMVAGQLLGARLMSFVSLVEVVGAVLAAWALLGQAPALVQLFGGLSILAGVILVKLGEPEPDAAVIELVPLVDLDIDEVGIPA
jgi:drug/metabolite transporter (DMT)-like permease